MECYPVCMKRYQVCGLAVLMLLVTLLGCGDTEEETTEDLTQPQPRQTTIPESQPKPSEKPLEVDIAAEEQSIREVLVAYDEAVTQQDIDDTMDLWVEKGDDPMFMVQMIAGIVWQFESWKEIRDSWTGTWALVGKGAKHTSSIERIGVDARAENGTVSGKFQWGGWSGTLNVGFRKVEDNWRIYATEYDKPGRIVEIEEG